ncbi:MAG: TolC family protein [Akkermansia sp.]|nr:TolC family protein [Akkermansia sp.]
MKFYRKWGVFLLPVLWTACAVYQPQPIDLQKDAEEWRQLSQKLCEGKETLSRQKLQEIGLQLNPELNAARLAYARSTAVAEFAGLWEDPEVEGEVLRVLQESVTNRGAGLSLTLPVTGLPGLAAKVAQEYKESDYWAMCGQERAFSAELDALCCRLLVTHSGIRLMRERLASQEEELARATKLHNLGEIDFADYQVITRRLSDARKALQERENEHQKQHAELLKLMGLHPSLRHMEISETLPSSVPAAVAVPTAEELLELPSIKASLSSYGASETELRAEIRRQYPEIKLNPMYALEDGNDKVGVGLGFSIPLWNRNRESIARATAERSIKKHDTVTVWRKLMQDAASLGDTQELQLRHCRAEQQRLAQQLDAAKKQESLFALGEISLPAVADAREETFSRRMNYLECLQNLMQTQIQLQYLHPQTFQK